MTTETQILAAFWSKGRKCFIPLTVGDASHRLGVETRPLGFRLSAMVDAGLLSVEITGGNTKVFEITPAGIAKIEVK